MGGDQLWWAEEGRSDAGRRNIKQSSARMEKRNDPRIREMCKPPKLGVMDDMLTSNERRLKLTVNVDRP